MSNISVTVKDGNNLDVTVSTRGTQVIKIDRGVSSGGGGGTVTQVTANTPLSVTNGTTTPDLSIAQATGSTAGYLTATDWSTFNSKVSTVSGTAPVTVTGTTSPTISMAAATDSVSGYLTSTDHATFNAKVGSITSADSSITVTGTTTRDLSVASSPNVVVQVRNATGATLTKGTAVYITGATGQLPTVTKAQANSDTTSAQTLGLMTTDLANNSNGYVTIIGLITNVNTSSYTDGQQLYLSPTVAGGLTATKPVAPQHMVYVAVVEHSHITQGKLFVKVQNGYELDELHDVLITSPTNGQTITYDSAASLWKNTTPTSGTVTSVSGTGTVSGLSLSGTVTTTGNLTLGGTLDLSSPPVIGGTAPNVITGTDVVAYNDGISGAGHLIANDYADTGYATIIQGSGVYTTDGTANLPTNFISGINSFDVVSGNYFSSADYRVSAAGSILFAPSNAINGCYLKAPASIATTFTLKLPNSAGSNNQVLKTDGAGNLSWITPNAGTVTSVGGTGSVSGLTLTGTVTDSGNLTLGGSLSLVSPPAIGSTTPNTGAFTTLTTTGAVTTTAVSDPSAPSSGNISVYGKTLGGYTTLAARNALNTSFGLQTALWSKNIQLWTNFSNTVGVWMNAAGNGYGTFAAANPTAGGTLYQAMRRSTYANVITTTNQILGVENVYLCNFRGGTAGQGGFFFHARFGFDTWTNGGRLFVGMATSTSVITADPSALNNTVGFCVDAADNGAISFLTRGTAATKASTGLTITSNKGYDVYFYCASNSSQYTWQIIDINTGTTASGTATATLPTNTTMQAALCLSSNAALTTASAIKLGVAKIYIESDY